MTNCGTPSAPISTIASCLISPCCAAGITPSASPPGRPASPRSQPPLPSPPSRPGADRGHAWLPEECHPVMMQTVYEAAGRADGLLRLAGAWHARVMADEVVSHAFRHGYHPDHTERLAA